MPFAIAVVPPASVSERIVSFIGAHSKGRSPLAAEPHITVKAQGGLTDDLIWLPKIERCVAGYRPFEIALHRAATFGGEVVYLKPGPLSVLRELHRLLLRAIQPSETEMARYFEGDAYVPHVTLFLRMQGFSAAEMGVLKQEAERVFAEPMTFVVSSLVIFRQTDDGYTYLPWREVGF